MNAKKMKLNIMVTSAVAVLCLVLITTYFATGLYAKYISRASGEDQARVASFVIESDLDRIELGTAGAPTLALGGMEEVQSVELPFYIKSGSEVSVGYSVTVDFDLALPSYLSVTLKNGTNSQTINANGVDSEFVFADFGTMPIGADTEQIADLTLTISVSDLDMITDEVSIPAAELTVRVYQLD